MKCPGPEVLRVWLCLSLCFLEVCSQNLPLQKPRQERQQSQDGQPLLASSVIHPWPVSSWSLLAKSGREAAGRAGSRARWMAGPGVPRVSSLLRLLTENRGPGRDSLETSHFLSYTLHRTDTIEFPMHGYPMMNQVIPELLAGEPQSFGHLRGRAPATELGAIEPALPALRPPWKLQHSLAASCSAHKGLLARLEPLTDSKRKRKKSQRRCSGCLPPSRSGPVLQPPEMGFGSRRCSSAACPVALALPLAPETWLASQCPEPAQTQSRK